MLRAHFLFTCQTAGQPTLRRPYSLRRRVRRGLKLESRRPERNRGRAGRQRSCWTHGPRRLATSRLVEVLVSAASPPNPKASRARRLRLAPHRPRWTDLFRRSLALEAPIHRSQAQVGTGKTCDRPPAPAITGAQWRAAGAPGRSGLDRRVGKARAASPTLPPRPPLPAPCLETLIRHPSVTRRDNYRKTYPRNKVGIIYQLTRRFIS